MSASILDVGAQRRQEAEQTLHAMANLALSQPYRGTFLVPGMPVVLIGATPKMTSDAFAGGIAAACQHWGAVIPAAGDSERQGLDTLQVVAAITDDIADDCDPRTVMEALAETMRVLLAGAIITAKDDFAEDDEVLVHFRTGPRFEIFPDVENNTIYVAGRARLGVTRKANPALSYLLGSNPSESQTLNIKLPNPRLFCGVDRLRFLDLRSPGHLVEEELVKVTA